LKLTSFHSKQVFNHFVFGFPPDWEECAAKLLEGYSSTDVLSESMPDSEEFAAHPESNIFHASLF
jgi:hypothetical protein